MSYPPAFVIPTVCSDTLLQHAARFRAHGRLPVLSLIHPKSKAPLLRSAQPLPGISSKRSIQDERLVELSCSLENADGLRDLLIVDARTSASALANTVKGRGSESVENYGGQHRCSKVHLALPNIHVVREWTREARLGALTGWQKGLNRLIEGAQCISDALCAGKAVLVHCSDGWDRTPQLTSLAMLLSDPSLRNDSALLDLVAAEWIWMGHRFATRCCHFIPPATDDHDYNTDEASPTFLQFLHAVRLLREKNINDFSGISLSLLGTLQAAAYRPDGPMAGDCERDRQFSLFWEGMGQ